MTERRPRAYIPKDEISASLIGDYLLSRAERDALRAAQVPAEQIIRMTTPDHNELHADGGSDKWWNLTIKLRGPELKAKDSRDTSIVAKGKRIRNKEIVRKFKEAAKVDPVVAAELYPTAARLQRRKATIANRGFPKQHRPFPQGRGFQRRRT